MQIRQAIALQRQGNLQQALWLFQQVLAVDPYNFLALDGLGQLFNQAGWFEEALNCFSRATIVRPNDATLHFNCGTALGALQRYESALVSFDKALALNPGFAEAHDSRGNTLDSLQRYDEALISYDKAIACNKKFAIAYNNRGVLLHEIFKRYDEALISLNTAITLKPGFVAAHYNRAHLLSSMERYNEALASYDRTIALKPGLVEAHYNRALLLSSMGRYNDALASYNRAISLNPGYADACYNKGLILLLLGDYERGWPLYEWRWKTDHFKDSVRYFKQALWLGDQPVMGKTLLLHAEQGLGDTIQNVRYIPQLERLGGKIILEVPAPLASLCRTLNATFTLIEKGEEIPPFDLHCPLMSLPLAFRTTVETIPATASYLGASAQRQSEAHERLGARIKPRIGLVWSGNPGHQNDHNRSMPLSALKPLLELDYEFHSLHKEIRPEERALLTELTQIHSHEDELHDFSCTAALINELDLVICVDTSVAHLAGALGKKVWILLPHRPDFRWMLEREDSPWYPTARLFRQERRDDWEGVINNVITALQTHPLT